MNKKLTSSTISLLTIFFSISIHSMEEGQSFQVSNHEKFLTHLENQKQIKSYLCQVCGNNWSTIRPKIAETIQKGVNTLELSEYDTWGHTLLSRAVEENDLEFVECLLQRGANPNHEVKGIHSDKPIFFAQSLEMIQLLIKYGAKTDVVNYGGGFSGGMNLLHKAINCNTTDDRIFEYLLNLGLNPRENLSYNENLWHSLISISIDYCPSERFEARAKKLKALGISPYHKDSWFNQSAIEIIEKKVKERETISPEVAKTCLGQNAVNIANKLEKFLEIMKQD